MAYWTAQNTAARNYLRTLQPEKTEYILPDTAKIRDIMVPHVTTMPTHFPIGGDRWPVQTLMWNAGHLGTWNCRRIGRILIKPTLPQGVPNFDFVLAVIRDLNEMWKRPSGRALIESINAVDQGAVTIEFVDGFSSRSEADLGPGVNNGTNGVWQAGTRLPGVLAPWVRIKYNPQIFGLQLIKSKNKGIDTTTDPSLEHWGAPHQKPPDVTLFHELVHADDYRKGILFDTAVRRGQKDDIKISEIRCVGLDEFGDPGFLTENTYRMERGVIDRPWYADKTELADGVRAEAGHRDAIKLLLTNDRDQRMRSPAPIIRDPGRRESDGTVKLTDGSRQIKLGTRHPKTRTDAVVMVPAADKASGWETFLAPFVLGAEATLAAAFGVNERRALAEVADRASRGQLNVWRKELEQLLKLDDFKAASKITGGKRNKIGDVDSALLALRDLWTAYVDSATSDSTRSANIEYVRLLDPLIAACETYLGRGDRLDSGRRPAVLALRKVALAYRAIFGADTDRGPEYLRRSMYAGNDPDFRGREGYTALGTVIAAGDDWAKAKALIDQGASVDAPQIHGWLPLDLARAKMRRTLERRLVLLGARSRAATSITYDAGATKEVVVGLLMQATCWDPEGPRDIRAAFETLWDNARFQPILRVAARSACERRDDATGALRIYSSSRRSTRAIAAGAGAGLFNQDNYTLTLGALSSQLSLEGTIIHELTHHACFYVFKNSGIPCERNPGDNVSTKGAYGLSRAYRDACVADFTGTDSILLYPTVANVSNADELTGDRATGLNKRAVTLVTRLAGYLGGEKLVGDFTLGCALEQIVSIPQALHTCGTADEVRQIAPAVLAYFDDVFLPALETFLAPVTRPRLGSARREPPPRPQRPTGNRPRGNSLI